MRLIVTGGAGYIGSIVSAQLLELGHEVDVIDNLSSGFKENLPEGANLHIGDIRDREFLKKTFLQKKIDGVLHFAAKLDVAESNLKPLEYYSTNVAGGTEVVRAALENQVDKFIFSSTAAVYGDFEGGAVNEDSPTSPSSPYGRSKLMMEQILTDSASVTKLKFLVLRYFNVAGSSLDGKRGSRHDNPSSLFRRMARVALGLEAKCQIYGDDYPTIDGTPIRDFIHVEDLAATHVFGLEYLSKGGASSVLNCGYGHGVSVRQVVDMFCKVSGREFPVEIAARRPGDIYFSVAGNEKIKGLTGWKPRFDDLETICRSALEWEAALRS